MEESEQKDTSRLVSAAEIAKLFNVSRGAVSLAMKNSHNLKGMDIASAAEEDPETGRIKFNLDKLKKAEEVRKNPSDGASGALGDAKGFASGFVAKEVVDNAAKIIPAIAGLPEETKKPLLATLCSMGIGTLGYFAGVDSENRGMYAIAGAIIGAGIYAGTSIMATYQEDMKANVKAAQKKLEEDRAMGGPNPSASNATGDMEATDKGASNPLLNPLRPVNTDIM